MAVGDNTSLHHVEISRVKEEIAQTAEHNVLKKAVIQLTLDEYNCLKAALLSTDTVFDYNASFITHHAKPTIAKLDERNNYIQPIRLPNNISKAIILSGQNDTPLAKEFAEDIQCTPVVTQIAMYQSDNLMRRGKLVTSE